MKILLAILILPLWLAGQTKSTGTVILDPFTAMRTNDIGGAPPPPDYNHLWFAGGEHSGQTCDTWGGTSGGTMLIQAPAGGTCTGQMVDGMSGPGMANVYWFPARDTGNPWATPCTPANRPNCEYTQAYATTVPGGTDWTTLNRMYMTITSDNTIALYRSFTVGALNVGYYVRSHDNTGGTNQGAHYYNYVNTGIYAGHKLYLVMNRKPQHNNSDYSGNGHDLYPEDPEFNDCCWGQGEISPVHWWDGETVLYYAAGVNLGGWTGNFTFTPMSLAVDPYNEPDDYVSALTGTYVGVGQETSFGGTYEVTWEDDRLVPGATNYHLYYSTSCSMHVCGISSGTSGGAVRGQAQDSTDASPYGVSWWNSPTMAESTNLWVAIRPDISIWSVSQQGAGVNIQVQTRWPYSGSRNGHASTGDRHWLHTGDQVSIANLCAAGNGTRTVTVIDDHTLDLGVQGTCSYSGYTSTSSGTMTALSDTQNFTEILIGPGANSSSGNAISKSTLSGPVAVK